MAFSIPVRPESFVKATDGEHLRVTLCQNHYRATQLFEQDILRFDPFQSGRDILEEDNSFYDNFFYVS